MPTGWSTWFSRTGRVPTSNERQPSGVGDEFVVGPNGTWLDYFNRLELHRQLFPESEYQLLGFSRNLKNGKLYAVVKQSAIRGEPASKDEVATHMARRGFLNCKDDDYYSQEKGLVVGDLNEKNLVKLKDGSIVIFDPIIETVKPQDFKSPTDQINGVNIGGGHLWQQSPPKKFPNPMAVTSPPHG